MKMNKGFIRGLKINIALAIAALFILSPSVFAKDIYRVEMRGTNFGGMFYVLGFGAMDILNKNSDWLRGGVVESSGSTENIKIVGKSDTRRKRTVFISTTAQQAEAEKGIAPFDDTPEKYRDVKSIMATARMANVLVTTNPNIKSFSDLKGKRISTWPKGSAKYQDGYNYVGGVSDDVLETIKWQFTQYQGYEDLLVGKTDAVFGFLPMVAPGKFAPGVKLRELMSRSNDIRFVGATMRERERSAQKFGDVYGVTAVLTKDSVKPGLPDDNVLLTLGVGCWSAYPELPEDVVYEMLTQWKDHYEQFKRYHPLGRALVPNIFGMLPIPREKWHKGAIKFYEDNNLPFGKEAFDAEQRRVLKQMNIK